MRKFIIHAFGGHTSQELRESNQESIDLGYNYACEDFKHFADQMYGYPADEWCKLMYSHICGSIKRLESSASDSCAVGESSDTPGYIEDAPYPC